MPDITVDLNTHEVLQRIERLAERIGGGLGPDYAGPAISREITDIEKEWFETGGGGTWPPLSPATITARANRWGYYSTTPMEGVRAATPVLVWTGRLFYSLTDPRGRGASDAVIRMSPTLLEQGTMVPYAKYHQSPFGRTARPPVKPLTDADVSRLHQVFLRFVMMEEGEEE